MNIVRDDNDRWRFVKSLYLLNDEYQDQNWHRDTKDLPLFTRPNYWPDRKPLVSILGWTLMSNHFHLLLQEIREGGIAKFMQRLGGSMSLYFNTKYKEQGSIFQSSYKGKTVGDEAYFRYLTPYILVKNTFELYPGGLERAVKNFDEAWEWALEYPFSSFGTTFQKSFSPTVDEEAVHDIGLITKDFKKDAKDMFYSHIYRNPEFSSLMLEKWQ